jgi:hypothetical protein
MTTTPTGPVRHGHASSRITLALAGTVLFTLGAVIVALLFLVNGALHNFADADRDRSRLQADAAIYAVYSVCSNQVEAAYRNASTDFLTSIGDLIESPSRPPDLGDIARSQRELRERPTTRRACDPILRKLSPLARRQVETQFRVNPGEGPSGTTSTTHTTSTTRG